jgi:hypothetical protein
MTYIREIQPRADEAQFLSLGKMITFPNNHSRADKLGLMLSHCLMRENEHFVDDLEAAG